LLTSFHEGSNNSIKEALYCNLPIVSVKCGDAEERLENVENCYICDYDSDSISEVLYKVYSSGKRSNGTRYITEVSLENCANQLLNFYQKII
jgi:teichuronic acid biosynthesis glycosyltransferase TuaC